MGDSDKRLYGPALLTNAAADTYVTPASTQAKLKHFHFFNEDAVSRTITVSIGVDAAGTRLFMSFPIASKSPYDWYPYAILQAAEKIQAYADAASQVTMTIFGTEKAL